LPWERKAAKTIQFRDGQDDRFGQIQGQLAEVKRGSAQPAELFFEAFLCEGAVLGRQKGNSGRKNRLLPA
jgi:hypothetical protein